jgi:hypothetical protein
LRVSASPSDALTLKRGVDAAMRAKRILLPSINDAVSLSIVKV